MTPTPYRLLLSCSAEKELERLVRSDRERVETAIAALANDPCPMGCKKLTAREGYRVRVGVYRVSYAIDDAAYLVTIAGVAHRKDAYRSL